MDQDLWLKCLHFHGSLLLQTILSKVPEPKSEAERDKQIMCKFIKKRYLMLFKQSDYLPNALPEHSVPIVPIELFQNASAEDRRDLFYKSLDRGHILILRVINDTLQDNYKLLALCKEENHMKLDDLSIILYLPKLKAEVELAGGKLESNDLIKAAVCSCSIDERKLYVTLDCNILEDEAASVQLGKITEEDLPFYVGNIDVGASYVDYLHNKANTFNKPDWVEELHTVLNLERNYLYSFIDKMDGTKYAPCVYAAELRKKQVLSSSNIHYEKAKENYGKGDFKEALVFFNKAISIYPKNVEALVSRGILHANMNNLRKAFFDMESALKVDCTHERARKEMSQLLVSAARTHIEQNNFKKAEESIDAALNVDGNNKDALTTLEEIRKRDISDKSSDKSVKISGSGKKNHVSSSSSEKSDTSSSKKDDLKEKEKQETFLEAATKAFLSSMKKGHHQDHEKKSHHHHKSRSKSPKRKNNPPP